MKTTYIGQLKVIVRNGRYFRITDRSADAATQAEWADEILTRPNVIYPNGRSSHECANEVLDKAEDTLIEYMLLVPTRQNPKA